MSSKRMAGPVDLLGQPIDPTAVYEAVTSYASGYFYAEQGTRLRGDSERVQANPDNWVPFGTPTPEIQQAIAVREQRALQRMRDRQEQRRRDSRSAVEKIQEAKQRAADAYHARRRKAEARRNGVDEDQISDPNRIAVGSQSLPKHQEG